MCWISDNSKKLLVLTILIMVYNSIVKQIKECRFSKEQIEKHTGRNGKWLKLVLLLEVLVILE